MLTTILSLQINASNNDFFFNLAVGDSYSSLATSLRIVNSELKSNSREDYWRGRANLNVGGTKSTGWEQITR